MVKQTIKLCNLFSNIAKLQPPWWPSASWLASSKVRALQRYYIACITDKTKLWLRPSAKHLQILDWVPSCRVFNKVLSRWQKLWSRGGKTKLAPKNAWKFAHKFGCFGTQTPWFWVQSCSIECLALMIEQWKQLII